MIDVEVKLCKLIDKECFYSLPLEMRLSMIRQKLEVIINNKANELHIREQIVDWCNANINGLFRFAYPEIYFELREDMVAFKIYWSGNQ